MKDLNLYTASRDDLIAEVHRLREASKVPGDVGEKSGRILNDTPRAYSTLLGPARDIARYIVSTADEREQWHKGRIDALRVANEELLERTAQLERIIEAGGPFIEWAKHLEGYLGSWLAQGDRHSPTVCQLRTLVRLLDVPTSRSR